jgi:ribosomal protein L11 methyltransferase
LASKLGASTITAIDNDEWSIENARENFNNNNCTNILLLNTGSVNDLGVFDIILANINQCHKNKHCKLKTGMPFGNRIIT